MIDYHDLLTALEDSPARNWLKTLPEQIHTALKPCEKGQPALWNTAIESLPEIQISNAIFNRATVSIGDIDDCDDVTNKKIIATYRELLPWRKGPYKIFGHFMDTEWRSNLKWDRLIEHIHPLKDRFVLDVGCGNGYHCWRMLGEHAARVIGIDPTLLFVHQFYANKHFLSKYPVDVLPVTSEQLPRNLQAFDTVFSMGVLYHRRSPIDHLLQLRDCLKNDGELVLETLIVDGSEGYSLLPEKHYAGMKNVWFIPTVATLEQWLSRCGFSNIRCIDITPTTTQEQRTTDWINSDSLIHSIAPEDSSTTREGYPAPRRAILIANR